LVKREWRLIRWINIIKVLPRTCPLQETSLWEYPWNPHFVINLIATISQ
jgi:hypothetical protein